MTLVDSGLVSPAPSSSPSYIKFFIPLHFPITEFLPFLLQKTQEIEILFLSPSSRSLQEMTKVVVKVDIYDEKSKKKAMQIVSTLSGVQSVSIDMKNRKLTVTGEVDPVAIVKKLRKMCCPQIESVGPDKEPEKKKEEPKKEEKKEEPKKKEDQVAELVKAYQAYNPHMTQYYFVRSIEEDPNACVIC